MLACLVKNKEYRALQQKSGIPDDAFYLICSSYANLHDGRLPKLDEIELADSEGRIKEVLGLLESNAIPTEQLLDKTNTSSTEEACIFLNKEYRDKNISITQLPSASIINIQTLPKLYNTEFRTDFIPIEHGSDGNFLEYSLDRLLHQYGYAINRVTTLQVESMGLDPTAKAFIYEGNVYINLDTATIDSAVHELLHLFLGSLRFDTPELYYNLVESAKFFEDYSVLSQRFKNRAQSDVNEEIFVEQLALYLTLQPSSLNQLSAEEFYQIKHNIVRMLDILLMGDISTESIDESTLFSAPLRMLGNYVQSSIMENNYHCTVNPKNAMLNRQLANLKEELIKKGDLIEKCL